MSETSEPTTGGDGAEVNPEGAPPEDDRNDEVEGSPVPDPTQDDGGADDIPGAD